MYVDALHGTDSVVTKETDGWKFTDELSNLLTGA